MPRMFPTCLFMLYGDIQSLRKMFFIHSPFFNKDFSLDIVKKSIKFLTVVLKSTMEGSVSHFFYVGFGSFFMLC